MLATKAFVRLGTAPHDVGLSRKHLIDACEASLRRLRTDYIDLYICHQPDMLVAVDETMRALDDLVSQGKVRYVGCSNHAAWQVMVRRSPMGLPPNGLPRSPTISWKCRSPSRSSSR